MKRNRLRSTRVAIAVGLSLTLLASACGGSDSAVSADTEIVVAMNGDIDNFDAHTAQLIIYQFAVGNNVFNSLVNYDADLQVQPDLATSWEVNDDATVFRFFLAEDATFHDGTPVTADAVAQNIERLRGVGSVWSARVENIVDTEVVSETELVITLGRPAANFLDDITAVRIIAPSSFDEATRKPVGSGPFRFVEWSANERIVLERNDDYFGTAPTVKRLEFRPISDEQVALVNMQAGDIDIVVTAGLTTVQQAEASGLAVVRPSYSSSMVIVEMGGTTGTIDDVRVRQALAHALDRDSVNQIQFNGTGELLSAPLPQGFWAYAPQDAYEFDLDKAAALLREAGADDLELTVEVIAGFDYMLTTARIWQENLAEIGVTLNVNATEISVWLDAYVTRNYDMIINVFPPAEPQVFFNLGLRPHLDDPNNWYDRPDLVELISQAVETSDQEERLAIYTELQREVMLELPILPVLTLPLASVTAADIRGFELDPRGWGIFTRVTRAS